MARLEALLRRVPVSAQPGGDTYRFGDVAVDFRRAEVTRGGEPVDLSAREFKLLRLLHRTPRRGASARGTAGRRVGVRRDASTRTVDVHVAGLRQKIEANPKSPSTILTVHGIGYKFVGERFSRATNARQTKHEVLVGRAFLVASVPSWSNAWRATSAIASSTRAIPRQWRSRMQILRSVAAAAAGRHSTPLSRSTRSDPRSRAPGDRRRHDRCRGGRPRAAARHRRAGDRAAASTRRRRSGRRRGRVWARSCFTAGSVWSMRARASTSTIGIWAYVVREDGVSVNAVIVREGLARVPRGRRCRSSAS